MFTGLVETTGRLLQIERRPPGVRLVIQADCLDGLTSIGESVSINGCCLTVVAIDGPKLSFDAGEETLARTTFGQANEGDSVNLERSLQAGARLGGHFVTGHIDCVGTVEQLKDDRDWRTIWVRIPQRWLRHLASKGSVAMDGISLTVVDVTEDAFSVALIPHTLEVTTIGGCRVGSTVNIETDVLAKYVEKAVQSSTAARNN